MSNIEDAVSGLVKALEFYADPFGWHHAHPTAEVVAIPDFYSELEFGEVAQIALSSYNAAKTR